jgi:hypothetical protein
MITLSDQPTVSDARPSITGAGTASTRPAPTLVGGASEATLVEGRGAAATLVDRAPSAAPTLIESLGAGAAPTLVEKKVDASAAPTVIERKVTPFTTVAAGEAKPKPKAMLIGIAAAAVLVVGIAGVMLTRGGDAGPVDTTTSVASITGTAPASTSTAPPGRNAVLVLTGSPYTQLDKLEHLDTKQTIELSETDRSFPLRVADLAPGSYRMTLLDRSGKPFTREIRVDGVATWRSDLPPSVDLDQVVEDILKQ